MGAIAGGDAEALADAMGDFLEGQGRRCRPGVPGAGEKRRPESGESSEGRQTLERGAPVEAQVDQRR